MENQNSTQEQTGSDMQASNPTHQEAIQSPGQATIPSTDSVSNSPVTANTPNKPRRNRALRITLYTVLGIVTFGIIVFFAVIAFGIFAVKTVVDDHSCFPTAVAIDGSQPYNVKRVGDQACLDSVPHTTQAEYAINGSLSDVEDKVGGSYKSLALDGIVQKAAGPYVILTNQSTIPSATTSFNVIGLEYKVSTDGVTFYFTEPIVCEPGSKDIICVNAAHGGDQNPDALSQNDIDTPVNHEIIQVASY